MIIHASKKYCACTQTQMHIHTYTHACTQTHTVSSLVSLKNNNVIRYTLIHFSNKTRLFLQHSRKNWNTVPSDMTKRNICNGAPFYGLWKRHIDVISHAVLNSAFHFHPTENYFEYIHVHSQSKYIQHLAAIRIQLYIIGTAQHC